MPRRSTNHVQPASSFRADHPDIQTGITVGGIYRDIEASVDSVGAATGGAVSPLEFARWVGTQLLSRASGEVLGSAERLPQVWGDAAQGYAQLGAPEAVHVRPHGKRPLSAEARERIAEAQRLRWRRAKQKEREEAKQAQAAQPGRPAKLERPANWAKLTAVEKQRWYYKRKHPHQPGQSETQSKYWAQFTPEEKSREMKRRMRVRQGLVASKAKKLAAKRKAASLPMKMPKGYWQGLVTKLLAKGPKSQHDMHKALAQRHPDKSAAIYVTLASLKKSGVIVGLGEGMFGLPVRPNGAAPASPVA